MKSGSIVIQHIQHIFKNIYFVMFLFLFFVFSCSDSGNPNASNDSDTRLIIKDVFDDYLAETGRTHNNTAITVGIIEADDIYYYHDGDIDLDLQNGIQQPDENTLFAIGSVSKVLTTTLLSVIQQNNLATFSYTAEECLPAGINIPDYAGQKITLLDLATHTSGLPSINMPNSTADELFDYVSNQTLTHSPGTVFQYSNIGMALLGEVLAYLYADHTFQTYNSALSETLFEEALKQYVLNPLGMNNTKTILTSQERINFIVAEYQGQPVTNHSNINPFDASGGVYSTSKDLITLLSAYIQAERKSARGLALSLLEQALIDADDPVISEISGELDAEKIGLGWNIKDDVLFLKTGSVPGFNAVVIYSHEKSAGVVILSATSAFGIAPLAEKIINQL
jgi:D-alanyl-D-alanine-carboxypeptidase/D-alanyl-D-alanine-endopeptidase